MDSESAQECVTTHLPNAAASKMDGAQASNRYFADGTPVFGSMGHRVGGRGRGIEA